MGVAEQQLLVSAEKRPAPRSRSELSRKEAELAELKKNGVERALAFLAERGETKDAERLRDLVGVGKIDDAWELAIPHIDAENEEMQATKKRLVEKLIETLDSVGEMKSAEELRGLLETGNISDALEVAAQQASAWAEKKPDPWSRSKLSSENRAAMMDKAGVFGVSFATVVAYEMARARVPTSTILKTMRTYDALDEYLMQQIDRINKHVDDQHLHYRLWKLSSAIDDTLSENASGR